MVSFVILDYNSSQLTARCVQSIRQHVPSSHYEIIIVDNGGQTGNARCLDSLTAADCRIVHCHINGGFGLGNQLGAHLAKGQYLCFLNSDVELTHDCITPLTTYLTSHPRTGCITPRQTRPDGKPARSFRHNPAIRHEIFGYRLFEKLCPHQYPSRDNMPETPFNVPQINGSFMLFPAKTFWAIGGFDTNIFLFYEEYDLGMRLRRKGFTCTVYPQATFLHCHGATIDKTQTHRNIRRELLISQIYVYRKHHTCLHALAYQSLLLLEHLFRPHHWYLLPILCRGEALSRSLRHTTWQKPEQPERA